MPKGESAPRAPRRFIESQLTPVVQAFGYEGGWSVERRAPKREESPADLAASVGGWPCGWSGCGRTIRWQPGKRGPRFPKYCRNHWPKAHRAYHATRSRWWRQANLQAVRERDRERASQRTTEQKSRLRNYNAAYKRRQRENPAFRERERKRSAGLKELRRQLEGLGKKEGGAV